MIELIEINDKKIPIMIQYRNRKTIGIHIRSIEDIRMFVPVGVSKVTILDVLHKKQGWIEKKIKEISGYKKVENRKKQFIQGESFWFFGKEYSLVIETDPIVSQSSVNLIKQNMIVKTSINNQESIQTMIEKWYMEEARKVFIDKTKSYGNLIGRYPNSIKIKDQKTRWGSCSSKGNINYNWRIVMAPEEVIDYIVVHELSHLIHMNHSKDFWSLVQSILPRYKESRNWLKQNGNQLALL